MAKLSFVKKLSKLFNKSSGAAPVFKFALPSLSKASTSVATVSRATGRQLLTWGNTLKGAIIAGGGVVAYEWFGSGIPNFFAETFNVSEDQGSWIAIICFVLIFMLIVALIINKLGIGFGKKPRRRKRRY